MASQQDIEQLLRSALPAASEAQQATLARRLAALLAGTPTPEALREQLLADSTLAPLLAALAGTQIQAGSSVIDFGAGSQVGDVAIRDVAGGNIVTLNVYYDTPRAAPAVQPPPSQLARPLRVFLCHAAGDKPAVRQLHARLRADGFAPWLDEEDLVAGQVWQHEIPKAVRAADVVVVCLSAAAVTKTGYVQKEIRFALDIAAEQPEDVIFLIPLRLDSCEVPERLSRWQWVDSFEPRGYERLVRALRIRANQLALGAPPSQPGTPAPAVPTPPAKAPAPGPGAQPQTPAPQPSPVPTVAALWRQALAAYLMRQWPQAAALLAEVAERDPAHRDVQARLAETRRQLALLDLYHDLCALRDDDHWQAVLDGLAELEQRQPAYPDPRGLRAWAECRRQREQHFDAALAAADLGDWPLVIAELDALLAVVPDDAEARALVAHARAELAAAEQERQRQAEQERRQREEAKRREAERQRRAWLAPIKEQLKAGAFEAALEQLEQRLGQAQGDQEAAALAAWLVEMPRAPFALRLRAAELVGKVGDPRYPVEPAQWQAELERRNETFGHPVGYWCYVREGRYQIGGSKPKEQPATIQLPAFWIARYPITVAQYAPFVAEGYSADAERWWTPEGLKWKRSGRETMQPYGWNEVPYSGLNQPVIGVTWYEATAFCAWLTERLGRKDCIVRLPTEAEWETAAAYDVHRQRRPYPWGEEEPTPERAIYDASGLGRPAPVGCCPAGVAACGALDLAGNVWEWTASSHKGYPAQSSAVMKDFTSDDYDVPLRGGSYYDGSTSVRCGARVRLRPGDLADVGGFRVVVSPRSH